MKTPLNTSPSWFQLSDFGAALALANLYLLAVWNELQDHFYDYYRDIPYQTWPIFGKSIAYQLLLACLFWPLIACVRRIRAPMPIRSNRCPR